MKTRQIGDGRSFLQKEELRQLRSIVAKREAPTASSVYHFFSTEHILNSLINAGWFPVVAQEMAIKTVAREGFQKHMIRFRQAGTALKQVGDEIPELILTNSHDASAAYLFMVGFFQLACLNGLIVCEAEFGTIRIPHRSINEKDVIDVSYRILDDVPRLTQKINDYKQIELKPADKELFAEQALLLKYDDGKSEVKREGANLQIGDRRFSVPVLLQPRRVNDDGNSLWKVFSTVQENLLKGNNFERTVRFDAQGHARHARKTREIKSIDENIRINKSLWELTEETAVMIS